MVFIKDGKTEYKIITDANLTDRIKFAARELSDFLSEATGCLMKITAEKTDGKAIILHVVDKDNDGYRIYSENGNYIVEGYNDKGVIFGVYALLRRLIGLTFFTPTVYDIKKGDVDFLEIDEERIPDIPARAIGIVPLHSEVTGSPMTKEAFRMGVSGMADNWGICNHSYFKILPPDIYREKNPDWYSKGDDGVNLCLTNKEMRNEFVRRVKEIVLANPNAKYFMLGQEDHPTYCECENCTKALRTYKGYASMLMIEFTNAVVKEVNEWLKERNEARERIFVMFAYQSTIIPPVKRSGETFEKIFDFEIEKNLAVMLAPLGARGDKSYFDEDNYMAKATCYYDTYKYKMKELLLGWRAIVEKVCVWSYCVDYSDLFTPFNCWDAFEENYRWFKKIGAEYVFEEGAYCKYIPNFSHLRSYIVSKLMWDSSVSMEKTIDEFFAGYYGASASPYMRAYFDFLREHCRKISREQGRPMLFVRFDDFSDLSAPEYWHFKTLLKAARLHEEAVAHADEACKDRVEEEGMPVWFILLLRYNQRLKDTDRASIAKKVLFLVEKYSYELGGEGISAEYLKKIKKYIDGTNGYVSGMEYLNSPDWSKILHCV